MITRSELDDWAAISGAGSPDQLWRYLATHPTLRAMPEGSRALSVFRTLHKAGTAPGALATVALLCTDPRWRRVTAPLIVDIDQTDILREAELDELADGFLWDDHYAWVVPQAWLRDETMWSAGRRPRRWTAIVLRRGIPPPLRRWAAARIARRHPERSGDVLERIEGLDARAGDAAMAGLLDACVGFPDEVRDVLIELGSAWPTGRVRLVALQLVAARDADRAVVLALGDPSEKIRVWGRRLAIAPPLSPASAAPAAPSAAPAGPPAAPHAQLPLFG
jgi:hypothetical protein